MIAILESPVARNAAVDKERVIEKEGGGQCLEQAHVVAEHVVGGTPLQRINGLGGLHPSEYLALELDEVLVVAA